MSNVFSKNRYVEFAVEVLLFLVAVNFLHYGQLILPVIALILFIDNKFKIKQPLILLIAILFGLSFFWFGRSLGFYSVMGLTLPFAVYIGSCVNADDPDNIKKLIYLLAFGMAIHVVLNIFYELYVYDLDLVRMFSKPTHFDIWTGNHIKTTGTAMNMFFLISAMYYLLKHEANKLIKVMAILIFILLMIYNVALGKRMVYAIVLLSFLISVVLDVMLVNRRRLDGKLVVKGMVAVVAFALTLFIFWHFNILGFSDLTIVRKFVAMGLKAERLVIYSWGLPLLGSHMWGGQEISSIIGIQFHDLFFDIYDYAGIVSFILMIVLYVLSLMRAIRVLCTDCLNEKIRTMAICLVIITTLSMFLEPVMTGESLFLICTLMLYSAIGAYARSSES